MDALVFVDDQASKRLTQRSRPPVFVPAGQLPGLPSLSQSTSRLRRCCSSRTPCPWPRRPERLARVARDRDVARVAADVDPCGYATATWIDAHERGPNEATGQRVEPVEHVAVIRRPDRPCTEGDALRAGPARPEGLTDAATPCGFQFIDRTKVLQEEPEQRRRRPVAKVCRVAT
jgi:hypothetical protein